MDYKACWEYQQRLFDTLLRAKGTPAEGAGYLLLVEHPAVYTLGKSGHAENLLVGEEYLRSIGAEFYHIDRGGDITFHGPGQIVGYPILDLERIGLSLRDYIDALEGAVIRTVARYGIRAGRIAGASGVWIEGAQPARKICAIGVRASRYVTMHGFALFHPYQPLRVYGPGRHVDRKGARSPGSDGGGQTTPRRRFMREFEC